MTVAAGQVYFKVNNPCCTATVISVGYDKITYDKRCTLGNNTYLLVTSVNLFRYLYEIPTNDVPDW